MKWRKFLTESGTSIWTSISELIEIAAEDHPDELRLRRDSFAEQLFSLHRSIGNGCDDAKPSGTEDSKPAPVATRRPQGRQRVYRPEEEDEDEDEEGEAEPQVKDAEDSEEEAPEHRNEPDDTGSDGEEKETHDPIDYETAEQLTRDLDNEQLLMDQIAKIGRKLEDNSMGEHDLHSLLRRLDDMHITTEVLKQTGIGKHVVSLRSHPSKQVRDLSKQLYRGWREMAKVWMKSAGSLAKSDSLPMEDGEHGLPSPPLDESDLLAARDMDFSQVLADMEDDDSGGSGQMNGQDAEYRPYAEPLDDRPYSRMKKKVERVDRRTQIASSSSPEPEVQVREKKDRVIYSNGVEYKEFKDGEGRQRTAQQPKSSRKDTTYVKDEVEYASASVKLKSSSAHNAYDRDASRGAQANGYHTKKDEHMAMRKAEQRAEQRTEQRTEQRIEQRSGTAPPSRPRPDTGRSVMSQKPLSPEISVAERLEAAKRKLHERYEEAEAVKKSRTVQVMDLHELPKGGPNRAKHPNAAQKPKLFKSGHSIRR